MRRYRRLLHAIDNYGLRGTMRRLIKRVTRTPESEPAFNDLVPHPFDHAHGTDTGGFVPGETLSPGGLGTSGLYNTAYYAISPSSLSQALALLPDPVSGYTFLDLGCGKGRAVLVAAELPFQHLIGVEISPALAAVARQNATRDPRIAILQQDAATLTFPTGPLVIFMYHPFLRPLLRRVLSSLARQRAQSPDPTYLLYANCTYQGLIGRLRTFHLVWEHLLPLSPEDAAADRHGITHERYTLYRLRS